MRFITPLLISSILLTGSLFGDTVEQDSSNISENYLSEAEVNAYLKAIVVEDFDFHRATFSEALEKLDEVVAPFGLQILFRQYGERNTTVSLKTRNLSLSKNLTYLCQQAGYDWWIEEGIVVVAAPGSNDALVTEIIPLRSTTASRLVTIQSLQN